MIVLYNNQKWRVVSINNKDMHFNAICMDDTLAYPPIKKLYKEEVEILKE
tara:strand:+ start:1008 stop:1157 length:150 start_codon:yes stop_codon:yes gene_type:complete